MLMLNTSVPLMFQSKTISGCSAIQVLLYSDSAFTATTTDFKVFVAMKLFSVRPPSSPFGLWRIS